MTGKVIDNSATGLLVLILPLAFLIVLLFKAWPVLLALFVISVSLRVWQQYQWRQWSKQVNPYFNQLIKENQGCLTALDLSMKANLSGSAAQWYLDKKAEEFGAQRREYEDKGTVYYFLTASALGSLFEDSEPAIEAESEDVADPTSKLLDVLTHKEHKPATTESSTTRSLLEALKPSTQKEPSSPVESVEVTSPETVQVDLEPAKPQEPEPPKAPPDKDDLWEHVPEKTQLDLQPLIQAELAKRLDVHSSTVGKRKSDPDFPEWSQSRDPEGIAWQYSPETKEFLPLETLPEVE